MSAYYYVLYFFEPLIHVNYALIRFDMIHWSKTLLYRRITKSTYLSGAMLGLIDDVCWLIHYKIPFYRMNYILFNTIDIIWNNDNKQKKDTDLKTSQKM